MPRRALAACPLLLAALLAGPPVGAGASPPAPSAAPSTARAVYEQYCTGCHGPSGRGDGPMGQYLDPRPRDFTDPARMRAMTDDQLRQAILDGRGPMPAWRAALTGEQVDGLVTYVRSLSAPSAPPSAAP